jgi:hypothetical protein
MVQAYLVSKCTKFHAARWTCWFLRPFIWTHVSGLLWFCHGSDKGTASNFEQISEEVWQRLRQWLDKHWGKKAWAVCGKSKLTKTEKGKTGEEQSQEHANNFLSHHWGLFTKSSSWQAEQSIPHTIVTFYGDCVKMYEDFIPIFGDKRTGCCISTMYRLTLPLSPWNFLPKSTWLSSPTHPTFLCFTNWR